MEQTSDSFLRLCGLYLLVTIPLLLPLNEVLYHRILRADFSTTRGLEIVLAFDVFSALVLPIFYKKHIPQGFNKQGAIYAIGIASIVLCLIAGSFFQRQDPLFPSEVYCAANRFVNYCDVGHIARLSLIILNSAFLSLGFITLAVNYLSRPPQGKRKVEDLL